MHAALPSAVVYKGVGRRLHNLQIEMSPNFMGHSYVMLTPNIMGLSSHILHIITTHNSTLYMYTLLVPVARESIPIIYVHPLHIRRIHVGGTTAWDFLM